MKNPSEMSANASESACKTPEAAEGPRMMQQHGDENVGSYTIWFLGKMAFSSAGELLVPIFVREEPHDRYDNRMRHCRDMVGDQIITRSFRPISCWMIA